jgi:hypothetical protein
LKRIFIPKKKCFSHCFELEVEINVMAMDNNRDLKSI